MPSNATTAPTHQAERSPSRRPYPRPGHRPQPHHHLPSHHPPRLNIHYYTTTSLSLTCLSTELASQRSDDQSEIPLLKLKVSAQSCHAQGAELPPNIFKPTLSAPLRDEIFCDLCTVVPHPHYAATVFFLPALTDTHASTTTFTSTAPSTSSPLYPLQLPKATSWKYSPLLTSSPPFKILPTRAVTVWAK
ncbi:hypothetical protein V500_10750 [Pseudogymnoascus sp. VKM F-4518 (FW-2643)]|nr:hypothetical protein V500_10750 [Pseudogymnoascus sp. VKM F-4518 (FW-2643)]